MSFLGGLLRSAARLGFLHVSRHRVFSGVVLSDTTFTGSGFFLSLFTPQPLVCHCFDSLLLELRTRFYISSDGSPSTAKPATLQVPLEWNALYEDHRSGILYPIPTVRGVACWHTNFLLQLASDDMVDGEGVMTRITTWMRLVYSTMTRIRLPSYRRYRVIPLQRILRGSEYARALRICWVQPRTS